MGFATWWRPYTTRRLRRRTRFRGASQGRTGCATPPTTLTLPPRMTTSAATWRRPTATWKRRPSMMYLHEYRRVQLQKGENHQERWLRTERGRVHKDSQAGLSLRAQEDLRDGDEDSP